MRIIIAMTGASGSIYTRKLLRVLKRMEDIETFLIISKVAKQIIDIENFAISSFLELADHVYNNSRLDAPLASGTFQWDSMVVVPCSMKSLSAIANGLELNLILRAAQVTLKENRQLLLVPRETPLNSIQLQNFLTVSQVGATVLPPCPAFYNDPQTISDLVEFIVAKILNVLNIHQDLISEWKGKE